jgi:hypothetical protein
MSTNIEIQRNNNEKKHGMLELSPMVESWWKGAILPEVKRLHPNGDLMMKQFIQRDRKVEASSKLIIIYGIYGLRSSNTFFSSRERLKDGTFHKHCHSFAGHEWELTVKTWIFCWPTWGSTSWQLESRATNMGPLRDVYDLICTHGHRTIKNKGFSQTSLVFEE